MTQPKDPLFTKFRTMAILCMLLGPLLVSSSLITIGASHLLEWARVEGAPIKMPEPYAVLLRFSERSVWVMVPIGVLLFVAGLRAVRSPARGRPVLAWSAWATVLAMIALSITWSWSIADLSWGIGGHLFGWSTHLLQAVLVAMAARFLGRDDVKAVCEARSA